MRLQRIVIATVLVAAVAVAGLVTWELVREDGSYDPGGDDRFATYCEEVEAQQKGLGEALAAGGGTTGLLDALPAFRALAAEAPRDIADDWAIVVTRIEDLEAALADAGVDPASYDRDTPPEGLDEEARDRIAAAASALAGRASQAAFNQVSQHARDVCHTPLHF